MFGKYSLNNLQFLLRSKVVVGSNPIVVTLTTDIAPVQISRLYIHFKTL